ncbi:MAG: DUF924 domain-containing protein [Gammaproteobacteria bacterium HGW-Gammaproteobacteria-8]|nr:MAG: DUF924 domain-containing protein [Gammaproteobacteria bacterium HGW-Gammaproteobacteria-8]
MPLLTHDQVIDFWFGDLADSASIIAGRQAGLWWGKAEASDALIRDRFGPLVEAAATGALDGWAESAEGRLGLILVTDQFTRTIGRGTPAAFALDPQALALCINGIEQGHDQALLPIQRVFFYLPLEHSEDLDHQRWCVDLMKALAREADDLADRTTFEGYVDFAEAHLRIIERFGRFPHRNAILGRASTPEETEFLQQPGSSF